MAVSYAEGGTKQRVGERLLPNPSSLPNSVSESCLAALATLHGSRRRGRRRRRRSRAGRSRVDHRAIRAGLRRRCGRRRRRRRRGRRRNLATEPETDTEHNLLAGQIGAVTREAARQLVVHVLVLVMYVLGLHVEVPSHVELGTGTNMPATDAAVRAEITAATSQLRSGISEAGVVHVELGVR